MFPLIDRLNLITANAANILYNIFTNILPKEIKFGVCVTDITDHYPIFQISNSLDVKHNSWNLFSVVTSLIRLIGPINCFKNNLKLTNWDPVLVETSPINTYKFFNKFMDLYNIKGWQLDALSP